ncbi:MAG: 3-phosphoserine/phosphohydroxythreonine transaminase [Spirochaetales bacterium]|nr:3-phosphoserine/phosphohydroxythreonine transaminase [Spirochaetales bacterium]
MSRVYNFSAGPSMLPENVLKQAQEEMLECRGSGMSVTEMSHRSKVFDDIIVEAESLLRELMNIPANYKVLFLQGGASTQFAMVPMNLFRKSKVADFINTGAWSKKAISESKKFGKVNVVASSEGDKFTKIPDFDSGSFTKDADFFHITTNNTIEGTVYKKIPDTGNVPLVADMSSSILSEFCDVTKYGIIYAGAQKNIAPAGLTIVIIREDLIGHAPETVPTMLNYKTHADSGSLYNTPPCYTIYIAGLVFKHIKDSGGIPAIEKINREKAALLYDYLDDSDFFKGTVDPAHRSLMNVPFILPTDELSKKFISEAAARGLVTLAGHRSVGGMRASIYNAMPIEGVKKLVEFMKDFEVKNK